MHNINPILLIHIITPTADVKLLNATFADEFIFSPSETQMPAGG